MSTATAIFPQAPEGTKHAAVLLYPSRRELPEHEGVIHRDIARRIADLLDVPFEGIFDPGRHEGKAFYYVPSATVIGEPLRAQLGLQGEMDLFGGYCPFPFLSTKAITHGVLHPLATRPEGWTDACATRNHDAVLPGYTVFTPSEFREAGERLLAQGPVRIKPVDATAGRGQVSVRNLQELERAACNLDTGRLATCGVVLERHLDDVRTYSVGQVRFSGLVASYVGTQHLTRDNRGEEVYGGSTLEFARGGYEALLQLPLSDEFRDAIRLARLYDHAASVSYPGFFASRRNYDVAAGVDARGDRLMGVLEQSWRIGGASRAEIAALEIMAADPACTHLKAATLERFGTSEAAPAHAIETFSGKDPELGLIRKYVMVEAYGNTK